MRKIEAGLHVHESPQRFYGLEVGARMTVLDTGNGLLLHSPLGLEPGEVEALGEPKWVLSPNKLHHLYAGAWIDAGLAGWAAPGLPDKRPDLNFSGVLDSAAHPFGPAIEVLPLKCFPFANEVVVLHKPSRTLIVTDLVFHFTAEAPWLTRAAMWCACGYPGCQTTLLERVGFHRAVARQEIAQIADWDFDRLIMAHGEIIETGGKQALLDAMRWLN